MAAKVQVELEFKSNGQVVLKQTTGDLNDAAAKAKEAQGAFSSLFQGIGQGVGQDIFRTLKAGLVEFTAGAVMAQDESLRAINALNLALANQGNLTGDTSQQLQEYATHLQDTTRYSDEAVMASEAMFASFGMGKDQIKETTQAAADFASATGRDLGASSELLAKAFAGNVTGLQRLGFHFTEGASKAQKFKEAIEQVNQRFGGAAAADAATYSGQMTQVKNAFGDAQEALGKFFGELASADGKGFGALKEIAKWLQGFFGYTLVIALSEARARIVEFFGFVSHYLAEAQSAIARAIPDSAPDGLLNYRDALVLSAQAYTLTEIKAKILAATIREQGDRAAASSGQTLALTNGLKRLGDQGGLTEKELAKLEKAAIALAKADEEANAAAADWVNDHKRLLGPTTEDLTDKLDDLEAAVGLYGGALKLTTPQLDAYVSELKKIRAAADPNVDVTKQLAEANVALRNRLLATGEAAKVGEDGLWARTEVLQQMAVNERGAATATVTFAQRMEATAGTLRSVGAVLGDVAGFMESLGAGAESMSAAVIGGLAGVSTAIGNAAHAMAGTSRTAMVQAGFGLGGAIVSGIRAGVNAHQLGQVASEAAAALDHAFGDAFERTIGTTTSEAIRASMQRLNIDIAAATLLHLDDYLNNVEGTAHQAEQGILDLSSAIQQNLIPRAVGMRELEGLFSMLRQEVEETGAEFDRETLAIVRNSIAQGTLTKGMRDYIAEQQGLVSQGAVDVLAGLSDVSGENAGRAFSLGFLSSLASGGLAAAMDQFGEAFAKITEQGGAVPGVIGEIMGMVGNEAFEGAVQAGQGLDDMLKGLANQGMITAQNMGMLGEMSRQGYQQALDAGASQEAALVSQLPFIRDAVDASREYGFELDANTQALVDQAEAMGYSFPPEPLQAIVDLMTVLVQGMGFDLPEAFNRTAVAGRTAGSEAAAGVEKAGDAAVATAEELAIQSEKMAQDVADESARLAGEIVKEFDTAGRVATDQANYTKNAWVQALDPAYAAIGKLPEVGQAFKDLGEDATAPLDHLRNTAQELEKALGGAAGKAGDLNSKLSGLPSGSYKVTWGTEGDDPTGNPPTGNPPPKGAPKVIGDFDRGGDFNVPGPSHQASYIRVHGGEVGSVWTPQQQRAGGPGSGGIHIGTLNVVLPPGATGTPQQNAKAIKKVLVGDLGGTRTAVRRGRRG